LSVQIAVDIDDLMDTIPRCCYVMPLTVSDIGITDKLAIIIT
jgi:hypothetical protein